MNSLRPKVVISLDFELGWGVLESELWKQRERMSIYVNLRSVLDNLIAVLKESEIATTWAIVGAILASDEKELDLEHLPESYRNAVIKFCRESSEMTRNGQDLIDKLQCLDGLIEVASHTSTHIYAEHPDVNSDHYIADVGCSISTLENYFGTQVKSLVFPRDQARFNNEVAARYPINYRLNPDYGRNISNIGRVFKGAQRIITNVPESKVIMGASGECYQNGSLYFNWCGGKYELIKKYLTKIQTRRMLSNIRPGDVYHVWLHPFNLAESGELFESFINFVRQLAGMRDKGILEVVTMDGLVRDCLRELYNHE